MKKSFSIGDLFRAAWNDYKQNWGILILIGIIFALVGMLGKMGHGFHGASIIGLLGWLLQMYLSLGFIRLLLNIVDGKPRKIEDIFHGAKSISHFVYFLVVALLYGAMVGLGMVLLVIPGLVALVGFMFAQYLIAEEGEGIFESFKKSWELTAGNRWKIFWLFIVVLFFNLFGLIALVIGLAITIPVTYLVWARLYRTLGTGVAESAPAENVMIYEETIIVETTDDAE
ncbi:hypothetical protein KC929_00660 [Patescibacteria group bacterium]|nr:hypothetical protein [Patescibacteria group bacterium]